MTDYPQQCPAIYDRILPGDLAPTHIRCTYLTGHEARHSFTTLQTVDEQTTAENAAAARRATQRQAVEAPPMLTQVLQQMEEGRLDAYIELILAAGHGRKLARRGAAGFASRRFFT